MPLYLCHSKRPGRLARYDAEIADAKAALKDSKDFESALIRYNDLRNRRDMDAKDDSHPALPGLWSRWLSTPTHDLKTGEEKPGVIETRIKADLPEAEGVAEGCINPWYRDGEMDEADGARDIAKKRGHLAKNHGDGKLTYNQVRRVVWGVEQKRDSKALADIEAVALIRKVMAEGPLGASIDRPDVTAAYVRLADAPAPTPKGEAALLAFYGAEARDASRQILVTTRTGKTIKETFPLDSASWYRGLDDDGKPLYVGDEEYICTEWKTVTTLLPDEVAKQDPWSIDGIPEKIPGWSPTDAYVGVRQDYFITGATNYNWQDNTVKPARTFTAGANYTAASFAFHMITTGTVPLGEITCKLYAGTPAAPGATLIEGTFSSAEIGAANWPWLGGSTTAAALGTVYTLELSTTCVLDGTNYIQLRYQAGGGVAGDQNWVYSGGVWSSNADRFNFCVMDNSDGGKLLVRADSNYSSLATVKGAALHSTDTITVTMGATLTMDANSAFLQARTGDVCYGNTAAGYGAQITGYRYGNFIFSAGFTCAFTGNATQTNSGLLSNPISADTSSKGSTLTINGTAANPVVLTNSVGAANINNKWCVQAQYGFITATHYQFKYNYSVAIYGQAASGRTTMPSSLMDGDWDNAVIGSVFLWGPGAAHDADMAFTVRRLSFSVPAGGYVIIFNGVSYAWRLTAGGSVEVSELKMTPANNTSNWRSYSPSASDGASPVYCHNGRYSLVNNWSTKVAPTGLALADAATGGELTLTWTNAASYAAGDKLVVYNASDDAVLGIFEATAGTGTIGGLTDDQEYTVYAKATSDNYVYSTASANSNVATPTRGDYITPAEEAARNTLTENGEADVFLGRTWKHLNVTKTGSLSVAAPADPAWGVAPVRGDGQVMLYVAANDPADVIYARYAKFAANLSWSAESETFKRTGSGAITVTGLDNNSLYAFTVYNKSGVLTSAWIAPTYAMPTGAQAVIDQVQAAVVAQANALALTDADDVAITAAKDVPPVFENVTVTCIKVFPDSEDGEPNRGRVNEIRYRVNVALCALGDTDAKQASNMLNREKLRDAFLGKRLLGMPEYFCERETTPNAVDLDALMERFQWFSLIAFEFVTLRSQG